MQPPPLTNSALEEAQTFPYYKTYWVGRRFEGHPLAAADGTSGYNSAIGDSVYYGDCASTKGIGGGSCELPLQVTTVIYQLHSNESLGEQRNTVLKGVPATIYDEGHSIELYTGRVAIELSSDSAADALKAARMLRPLNAAGSSRGSLPLPVYCPGLYGPRDARVSSLMRHLPGRVCQQAEAAIAIRQIETGKTTSAVP